MTAERRRFVDIKEIIGRQEYDLALRSLRTFITPNEDFATLARAAKLVSSIPPDRMELKPTRIAMVGSSTLDQFVDLLRMWLAFEGFGAEIWIAPFNTVTPTVLDISSELYQFKPDVVWLFSTYRDAIPPIPFGESAAVATAIQAAVDMRAQLWRTLRANLNCIVIDNNADVPAGDVMGNFAGQAQWSRRNSLRRYNLELAEAATLGVVIFDLDHLSSLHGKARWVDHRYWYHSKNAINFELLGAVAFQGARTIAALKGLAKKCLVLDLDNTLWGGVIGDDGLDGIKLGVGADGEAFVDIQCWAKSLNERGVILAICSKNQEEIAKEPFACHPDMRLKLNDIAVFRANWKNKTDNIRHIAETLNIGLDSIVFVDDNPVERNSVRQNLPMVSVPELPVDPSDFVKVIEAELYFETTAFSQEDKDRARYYRDNAERYESITAFTDQAEYLQWLNMTAEAGSLDPFYSPRMAQLVNKSNQFNLTTIRFSENELVAFALNDEYVVRRYKLIDRFGDNGLISVVVAKKQGGDLEIVLWVMSCRVLSRTMEEFVCNDMIAIARQKGSGGIVGRYLPTAKNKLVSDLYARLGFTKLSENAEGTSWRLPVGPETVQRTSYVVERDLGKNGDLNA